LAELLPASASFLLSLLFDHEDGGDIFLGNVWISPKYKVIKPRRLYFLYHRRDDSKSKKGQEVCKNKFKTEKHL
jgi:hypothetical protein